MSIPASIAKGMSTASFHIDSVMKFLQSVGSNGSSGLAGVLNASLDAPGTLIRDGLDFSDSLAATASPDRVGMFSNELRFSMSHAASDREAFGTSSTALKQDVDASFMSSEAKQKLSTAAKAATTAFANRADAFERVRQAYDHEAAYLIGLARTIDNVVTASSRAATQAQARLNEIQARVTVSMVATIVAGVALCCIVCVLIGRSISRPIRHLADTMRRMTGGTLDLKLAAPTSRDKMAGMSRAVLSFLESALHNLCLEADAAQARAATGQERALRDREKAEEAQADLRVVDAPEAGLGARFRTGAVPLASRPRREAGSARLGRRSDRVQALALAAVDTTGTRSDALRPQPSPGLRLFLQDCALRVTPPRAPILTCYPKQ